MQLLFVCLGNICRSPTAHGVFQRKLEWAGLDRQVAVDSAGTGAWHIGNAPDPRTQAAARVRGYDLSHLRARQTEPSDFERFDYILAMDRDNLYHLERMKPADYRGHLGLFLDFAAGAQLHEVPDPYYSEGEGEGSGFERVLDLVEEASDGLLDEVQRRLAP